MGVLKDFNTSTVTHDQAVDNGLTKYNIIRPGMSYLGVCTTQGCEGYRKRVICNRGLGNHLVNDDIVSNVIRCPCCNSEVVMEEIILHQCSATVVVHDQQEERSEMIARGKDIVRLGQRSVKETVFSNHRLVTIDARKLDSSCSSM